MRRTRTVLLALAPVLLHALAREADRGLGLVLRAEVEPLGLLVRGRPRDGRGGPRGGGPDRAVARGGARRVARPRRVGAARDGARRWLEALPAEAAVFAPLLLRPALTLVALLSVAIRPSYPYGFTLPVALTQDWGIGQDAAALAALLALRLPPPRCPAPRAVRGARARFLAYAVARARLGVALGGPPRATSPSTSGRRWRSATASRSTPRA